MSVRKIFLRTILGVAAIIAITIAAGAVVWLGAEKSNVGELAFERPLPIPPLLEAREDSDETVFELEMRAGTSELLAGVRSSTWGFNGSYLGPTLRAARGQEVRMEVTNNLPEASTVHWHGMHLPATADGGPHQPIGEGETWTPTWTIDQPAATLWYHPHPHERTEDHVYRGLAGMFIVDDSASSALQLPNTYGVDDIPVIVQDKRFEDDGELSDAKGLISPIGQLGDEIVVNGATDPHLVVETTRVRLRLLNASTARSYRFGFADERSFELIATDAGMLEAPETLEHVQLSPGERAEIVVGIAPGDSVVLRSFGPDLGETDFFNARFSGADDNFDILELRAAETLEPSPPLPDTLTSRRSPEPAVSEPDRRFELGSRDINDRQMDLGRIDQVVEPDQTEVWEVENRAGIPHNFHPHGTSFEILEYDGATPPPALTGLKDTVFVPPGVSVLIAATYRPGPDTPYMFHCHLLEHEDRGMMGQLVVGEPDAGDLPGDAPHEHP